MVDIHIPHGTNAGHRKHTRVHHDCVCFSCLMAHRKHWRDTRTAKSYLINKTRAEWKKRRKLGLPNPSYRKPLDKITRRRANIYMNGSSPYTKEQVLAKWGTDCHVCLRAIDWNAPSATKYPGWESGGQLDHVVPIARGGRDDINNVKPIHVLCNLRKGSKLMQELDLNEFIF